MKIYARNNKLYIEYKEFGKRIRKSTGLSDTKSNIAYIHRNIIPELERKLERGIDTQKDISIQYFTDMILEQTELKKPNTYRIYSLAVDKFFNFFDKNIPITNFYVKDIDSYIISLQKNGLFSNTIKLYLAPINLAFREAIRQEYIIKNPVEYARKPKKSVKEKERENKKKFLTPLQMKNMLNRSKNDYIKTFLYLAFYTGARIGEILALEWSDIDLDKNTISISKTKRIDGGINAPKNGRNRVIPILNPLRDYLMTLKITNNLVLPYTHSAINKRFKELAKSIGIRENVTPHITRHTFISMLVNAKENPLLVQHLVGHSNLDMINKVYSHYMASEDDLTQIEQILAI